MKKVSSKKLEIIAKAIRNKESLDLFKLFKINSSDDENQLTADDIENDKKKHKEIIQKVLQKRIK